MCPKFVAVIVLMISVQLVQTQNSTINSTTSTSTSVKPTNASTTTTPAPVPVNECLSLTKDTCCNTTNCTFVICEDVATAGKNYTGCQKQGDLTAVCANSSLAQNLCTNGSSTEAPTGSPTTPNATTPKGSDAPSTAAPDPCESFTNQTECCAATTAACSYISCTDPQDQPHTGCHVNTTDPKAFCKPDLSDLKDLCKQSPTTQPSTQPSEGPTTAGGGGTTGAGNSSTTTPSSGDQNAQTGSQGSSQKFDGASFVGGMVLMGGLVGIVFFGCKFYKARTERNYHTL